MDMDFFKKNTTLMILLFFLTSSSKMKNIEESGDYEIYVNQIVQSFADEMEKKYDLICIGHGGRMPHDVEEIGVKFVSNKKVSITEARILEVALTERFLDIINSNEKIRPFLREYPFKAERGKITISFRTPDDTGYFEGSLALVSQFKNKISYYAAEGPSFSLTTVKTEPYEEALKAVNQTPPTN